MLLNRVDSVGRAGVCGNGLCEVGELVAVADDGSITSGCAQDCPLPVLACPLDSQGNSCSGALNMSPAELAMHVTGASRRPTSSGIRCPRQLPVPTMIALLSDFGGFGAGRGVCVFGTGECSCDTGHIGTACDACAPLYTRVDGHCVASLVSNPAAAASALDPVPMLVAVLIGVLVVTCVAVFCVSRRHLAGIYDDCECCGCCVASPPAPTPVNLKHFQYHAHVDSRNWFARHLPCRRLPDSPVHLPRYGDAADGSWYRGHDSIAGSSSLFVPMPPPFFMGEDGDGYCGRGNSKGSCLSHDLDADGRKCRQGSPAVSTVPVADMDVEVVTSMAGAVLSSGRSVEEGLRICVPAGAAPPGRTTRDAAILTTDSGQWRKQTLKVEAVEKVQSEGSRKAQISSVLPSRSEWGMRFSSGVSSWDLSSSTVTAGAVEASPPQDRTAAPAAGTQLRNVSSGGSAESSLQLQHVLPPPPRRNSPEQSPPSMIPPVRAGQTLRHRATRPPPVSPTVQDRGPVGGEGDRAGADGVEGPLRQLRGHGWQAVELATMADASMRPWSGAPSPVHTPLKVTPRAEAGRSPSNLVWTKGLWSLDGSGSSRAEDNSDVGGTFIGPAASGHMSNVSRSRERSGHGRTLQGTGMGAHADAQGSSSTDVMPQSTEVGIDCYRSSTALTSVEQSQSMASRAGTRPMRDPLAYSSMSDGGTVPWAPAGSAIMSPVSASPVVPALASADVPAVAAPPADLGFGQLEQQVSELMVHVQSLQEQASHMVGSAPGQLGEEVESPGPSASGGTSTLGSLLEVPSELRADPSGSVNFIYGGGFPGSRF